MAITWGSENTNSSGNGMRLGYELTQSPSSVSASTTSVKITLKVYFWSRASIYDSTNSYSISGNFSGSGSANISHSGSDTTLIRTLTRTVTPSYNGSISSSFSATISGINAIGGSASVSGSITTAKRPYATPNPPSSVTSRLSGSNVITTWRNNPTSSRPYDNIYIRISVNGGSYSDDHTAYGTTTSYTRNISSKNITVRFALRAKNDAGYSSWAYGPTITIPPDPPWAPNDPGATRNSDTSHTIFWTNDNPTANDHPYSNLEVQRWDNVSNAWATIATLGVVSSYTNTSTRTDRQYRWRVRAKNSAGVSGWVYTGYWSTTPIPPGTPVATKTANDVKLTWSNSATHSTGVEVWHASNGVWEGTRLALLPAGSTTYTHTAPDPTKTHTYKLKNQSGADDDAPNLYSDFSGASNVIQLLINPAAPTKLSPPSKVFDATQPVTVTWQHNAIDSTAQTAYELRYAIDGGAWTQLAKVNSGTSSKTFAANTFSNGSTIEWQVRTYGQYATAPAYSPWSASSLLITSAVPEAGLVFPTAETGVDTSKITAEWSYYDEEGSEQAQYRVRLMSAGGAVVLEDIAGSGPDTTLDLDTILKNGTSYRIGISVQDGSGLWSPETTEDFLVSYALPPTPVITTSWDNDRGAVLLGINNTATDEAQAETAYSQLWRSTDWETYELVLDNLPPNTTVTDYIPAIGSDNIYKVISFSPIGAAAESTPMVFTTPVVRGWFWMNGGPAFGQLAKVRYDPSLSRSFSREKVLNQFAGRQYPVETAGEHRNRKFDLSTMVFGDDDASMLELEAMADLPAPICLRTPDGERRYVSLESTSGSNTGSYESASVSMEQVSRPNVKTMVFEPVVFRTNLNPDPKGLDPANYRATTTDITATVVDGLQALKVFEDASGGSLYVDPSINFTQANLNLQVGDTVTITVDVLVTVPLNMQVRTASYNGMALTAAQPAILQAPEDGWQTYTVTQVVTAVDPTGYVRTLVWPTDTGLAIGTGFYVKNFMVEVNGGGAYFDGDTWEGETIYHPRWTGTPNDSPSELTRGGTQ